MARRERARSASQAEPLDELATTRAAATATTARLWRRRRHRDRRSNPEVQLPAAGDESAARRWQCLVPS